MPMSESDFQLNSPLGKAILALAREGDYAHPGEEEAIALAMALVDRPERRRVLDVGCGRGGSAAWLARHGWGPVAGVDIDAESIRLARERYPGVDFRAADVGRLDALGLEPFDLVFLLTAFYAFPDQARALQQMRAVCRTGGTLLMMDYTRPTSLPPPPELGGEIGHPIVLETLTADLAKAGWQLHALEDWTQRFAGWYAQLLDRLRAREADILRLAGPEWYAYILRWYGDLHRALLEGRLGGAALTAGAIAPG
jgi:SAM-dependent methyltransferase